MEKITAEQQKADVALAIVEGQADQWAVEVGLTSMIKNATSPMGLNASAPAGVRAKFRSRMEAQIDAIVRQAFMEGAYRAITGLQDERKAMQDRGREREHRPSESRNRSVAGVETEKGAPPSD